MTNQWQNYPWAAQETCLFSSPILGGCLRSLCISEIMTQNKVSYSQGVYTEGKRKPDFLFPGFDAYHNPEFDTGKLNILGAKTTRKKRWRQVLAEANKTKTKHLITMEPAISADQTDQMEDMSLRLVVPLPIQSTYTHQQQIWLLSFKEFIEFVAKE